MTVVLCILTADDTVTPPVNTNTTCAPPIDAKCRPSFNGFIRFRLHFHGGPDDVLQRPHLLQLLISCHAPIVGLPVYHAVIPSLPQPSLLIERLFLIVAPLAVGLCPPTRQRNWPVVHSDGSVKCKIPPPPNCPLHILPAHQLEGKLCSFNHLITPLNLLGGGVGCNGYARVNHYLNQEAFGQRWGDQEYILRYSNFNIQLPDVTESHQYFLGRVAPRTEEGQEKN